MGAVVEIVVVVATPPRFASATEAVVAFVPPTPIATGVASAIVPVVVIVPPVKPVPAVTLVTEPVVGVCHVAVLLARLYGGPAAIGQLEPFLSLNQIINPSEILPGTIVLLPMPATVSR